MAPLCLHNVQRFEKLKMHPHHGCSDSLLSGALRLIVCHSFQRCLIMSLPDLHMIGMGNPLRPAAPPAALICTFWIFPLFVDTSLTCKNKRLMSIQSNIYWWVIIDIVIALVDEIPQRVLLPRFRNLHWPIQHRSISGSVSLLLLHSYLNSSNRCWNVLNECWGCVKQSSAIRILPQLLLLRLQTLMGNLWDGVDDALLAQPSTCGH